jgi:hypothetical protein
MQLEALPGFEKGGVRSEFGLTGLAGTQREDQVSGQLAPLERVGLH